MELRGLTPAHGEPGTETAQRFLASAYDSVEAVLQTLKTVRQQRRQGTGRTLRRLTSPEEDLLRAAIVFTDAGLDATLKQLIRDTLPALLETSRQAHDKFESFAADKLGTAEVADTKMMARYLTSPDPRSRLIEDYVYDLPDRACSRPDEVDKTAGALGIDDGALRKRIAGLRELFVVAQMKLAINPSAVRPFMSLGSCSGCRRAHRTGRSTTCKPRTGSPGDRRGRAWSPCSNGMASS